MKDNIEMQTLFALFLKQFDAFVDFMLESDLKVDRQKFVDYVIYVLEKERGSGKKNE